MENPTLALPPHEAVESASPKRKGRIMSDETKVKVGFGVLISAIVGFVTNAVLCTVFIMQINAKADIAVHRLERIENAMESITKDVNDLKIRVSVMEHQRTSYRPLEENGESATHQPWKARQ